MPKITNFVLCGKKLLSKLKPKRKLVVEQRLVIDVKQNSNTTVNINIDTKR